MQPKHYPATLQIPERTVKQIEGAALSARLTPELIIIAAIRHGVAVMTARCGQRVDTVKR